MGEIAYLNGELIPLSQAKISVLDRGFLYGDGLFETIRVYQGVPFLLEKHLERLLSSTKILKISSPRFEELELLVISVLEANDIPDGILKIIMTRGIGKRGLGFSSGMQPTLAIILTSGIPYTEEMYEKGFTAVFIPEDRGLGSLKSLSFLANVMAKSFAENHEAQEAFFENDGFVTEGTMSNVFVVKNRELATPSLDNKILPGITREQVIELADDLGIGLSQDKILKDDMEKADEVFATNSIIEIMPVVKLGRKEIGNGSPGEVTSLLRGKYKQSVSRYTATHSRGNSI